uniref:Transmembrane serine protease 7 n=1 Tax=Latimeria chalumnae TaxID=7897 RepID=H3A585_LATCH
EGKSFNAMETFPIFFKVSNISVYVLPIEEKLSKRRNIRKKGKKKSKLQKKQKSTLWNFWSKLTLFTLLVFIVVVIIWTLLWIFVLKRANEDALYFAGLFRLVNKEFVPEYREKDSREFISMTQNIQHVINAVYRASVFSRLYKQSTISDLSNNNNGGLLVHFWMVFIATKAKSQFVCEDCLSAILKNSIQTSLANRSSVGCLLGLPVDMDSVIVNAALRSDYISTTGTASNCVTNIYAEEPGQMIPLNLHASSERVTCHFKLIGMLGHLIRLTIISVEVEADGCITDSLTIYDSLMPIRSKTLYQICESFNSSSVSFVSTDNAMFLTFKSIQIKGLKSFHGHFEAISQKPCGGTILTKGSIGFEGNITSPYSPSFYPPKCSCSWAFKTPHSDLGIALKFYNYVLKQKGLKGCNHGWWKINEKMYCGYYIDHPTVFYAGSSDVNIIFHCSSKLSDPPLTAEYGSYNISKPCPTGDFTCSTGLCISQSQHCNGLDDCFDESDELTCSIAVKDCSASSPLKQSYFTCDGIKDCEDGSDELNCTNVVPCNVITYKCRNGLCIAKRNAKCDGILDCADGSDESSCGCGIKPGVQSRIIGGSDVEDGEWPWQVSLHFSGSAYCGASVISKGWLVSAAHCFRDDRLSDPRLWTAHLGMRVQGNAIFISEIKRIIVHEYYNTQNFDYDIALLQLRSLWPEAMNSVIQPICVPSSQQVLRGGEKCWVTGWGQRQETDYKDPTTLQKAEIEIINQTLCHSTYEFITPRMLCAGLLSGKRDACKGDSGGPLSCQMKGSGRWFLNGIVSWGYGCGRPNFPGVYTKVSKFSSWIEKHVPTFS